jgi:hypothetical protein
LASRLAKVKAKPKGVAARAPLEEFQKQRAARTTAAESTVIRTM